MGVGIFQNKFQNSAFLGFFEIYHLALVAAFERQFTRGQYQSALSLVLTMAPKAIFLKYTQSIHALKRDACTRNRC